MTHPRTIPEILAPVGSDESFRAALASKADAIYLGLAEGFNARSRTTAFTRAALPSLVHRAHLAGTKVYLTLNTLVFERELDALEDLLRDVVLSGVDALIVQDPATAFIAKALAPSLRLHASTQMTISSADGAAFAATLGISRVVLPRELSTKEIALFTEQSPMECEVFVHGALCMAWSGQCLTSEAFSERSANRGQCSQACRMPYEAIVDGTKRDLGDQRYLLSPQDLAAHDALPDLMRAGVSSLKIEGRYKGPAYVTTAVDSWRNWRDAVAQGPTDADRAALQADRERAQLTYSRGASLGFLAGDDHQALVVGTTPKHRGLPLGHVRSVKPKSVVVELDREANAAHRLRPGVGIKFELLGRPRPDPDNEPGGPVFAVDELGRHLMELSFGQPGPDLTKVQPGDLLRLTGDPEVQSGVERRLAESVEGRLGLHLRIAGTKDGPLRATATLNWLGTELTVEVRSESRLAPARSGAGLDETLVRAKIGGLGGTPFHLAGLSASELESGLYVPVAELKQLRRTLVSRLEEAMQNKAPPQLPPGPVVGRIRNQLGHALQPLHGPARIVPLLRTQEQLDALIASGHWHDAEVELDWMEMVGLTDAVRRARAAALRVTLATVRVQKPTEAAYDRRIAGLKPDAVLVRHFGALMHFSKAEAGSRPQIHGDFSLNVTNSITAQHLLGLGLETVTASHDLNKAQLLDLLAKVPSGRVAVTLHHHIPTFHNSHCVYAHLLSSGADYRTCGRPCEEHRIALRDYTGLEHPVVVDVGCRNTVFHGTAQSAAPLLPELVERGVRRFRVELVWEDAAATVRTLEAYRRLLAGEITGAEALDAASVHERFGITTPLKIRKK